MDVTLPLPEPATKRANVGKSNEPLLNCFNILIDTAEQQPFTFDGIHADADRGNRLLVVSPGLNLFRECLGRHPHSLGDYSIAGYVGRCHVERKSMDDAHGTILGFERSAGGDAVVADSGRRNRFEQELANLANCECAAVVVECSFGELLARAPEYDLGKKTAKLNRKILARSIIAWHQTYPVPWLFCDDRRAAEVITFRWMERFWEKHKPKRRRKGT